MFQAANTNIGIPKCLIRGKAQIKVDEIMS